MQTMQQNRNDTLNAVMSIRFVNSFRKRRNVDTVAKRMATG